MSENLSLTPVVVRGLLWGLEWKENIIVFALLFLHYVYNNMLSFLIFWDLKWIKTYFLPPLWDTYNLVFDFYEVFFAVCITVSTGHYNWRPCMVFFCRICLKNFFLIKNAFGIHNSVSVTMSQAVLEGRCLWQTWLPQKHIVTQKSRHRVLMDYRRKTPPSIHSQDLWYLWSRPLQQVVNGQLLPCTKHTITFYIWPNT